MGKQTDKSSLIIFSAVTIDHFLSATAAEIEPVRLSTEGIEPVHRMRVASRRLRNALDVVGPSLAPKKFADWKAGIRKITRLLSAARDQDVQIEYLTQFGSDLPPVDAAGIRRLLLRLQQQRSISQLKIVKGLDTLSKSGVLLDIKKRTEPLIAYQEYIDLHNPYLCELAETTTLARLEDCLKYDEVIRDPENITELHALRIHAKHLRYTMEIFTPLYPDQMPGTIRIVRQMQDWLGSIHDFDIWATNLEAFMVKERKRTIDYFGYARPYQRLVPGLRLFSEHCQAERNRLYAEFIPAWEAWKTEGVWEALRATVKSFHGPTAGDEYTTLGQEDMH